MNVNKRLFLAVTVILLTGIGAGFLSGFAYRDSLDKDFVNIWFQEFYELPEGIEPVPVFASVEVWYDRGTIDRFSTYSWHWGDGGYGPEERIPRGTVLNVIILFIIDATWDWLQDKVVGHYQETIESQYIAGSRTEFFCNCTYGIYGYVFANYGGQP